MDPLRTQLDALSDHDLRQKAQDLGLALPPELDRASLTDLILAALAAPADGSGFVNPMGGGDGSGFVNPNGGGDGSGFVNPNSGGDGSGFVNQTAGGDGSGFVNQTVGGDGSGFVNQTVGGDGSGFVNQQEGGDGSSFGHGGGDGSSFGNQLGGGESVSPSIIGGELPTGDVLGKGSTGGKSRRHNLGPGDVLTLHDRVYTITNILSESSGEAVIYLVLPPDGDQPCVLKLYIEQHDPSREPNAEALSRIRGIQDDDILELLDFGTGANKAQHNGKAYCFELSTFARGGTLLDVPDLKAKYTPAFVQKHVVPEIFRGLQILHASRIIHGDIKPGNIFYLDEAQTDLVIGDYGSAKTFSDGAEEKVDAFSTVIGTNVYMAPEQSKGVMSEKNDYYSFGVVLLHLLYPDQFAQDANPRKADPQKYRRFTARQFQGKDVVDFDPAYGRLNDLIGGLTLVEHSRRWGQAEVARWLKGERVLVNAAGLDIKPVRTGYMDIYTEDDLLAFIERYPDRWYQSLISDRHGFDALMDWYLSLTDLNRKGIFEQMLRYYQDEGPEYVREAIQRYLDPARPVKVGEDAFRFYNAADLRQEIRAYWVRLDQAWRRPGVDLKVFRYALFVFEFSLQQAAQNGDADTQTLVGKVLDSIAQALRTEYDTAFGGLKARLFQAISLNRKEESRQRARLLNLFHLFQPGRGIRDQEGQAYDDLEAIGLFFARQPAAYDEPLMRMELLMYLQKTKRKDLLNLSYAEFMLRVFAKEARTEVEVNKVRVDSRRHYQIGYTCWRSLSEALQARKVPVPESLQQAQRETYEFAYPKPFFQTPAGVYDAFVAQLQTRHHLPAEALSPANQRRLQRKLWLNGLSQGLGRGLMEWVAAVPLVLPLLFLTGLAFLTDAGGYSLLYQYASGTGLADYFMNAERAWGQVGGLYLWFFLCVGTYLLALIPRIWVGRRLQLIGKMAAATSPWTSIRGGTGFTFALWMLLMPGIFALSSWLWEPIGLGLLGMVGVFTLRRAQATAAGETKRSKVRLIALLLFGVIAARLGLEVLAGAEFSNNQAPRGRGGVDILFYLVAGIIFYLVPIYTQLFRVHHRLRYGLKVVLLSLAGLAMLFLLPGSPGQRDISIGDLSSLLTYEPPAPPDPMVPDVYVARISDGYSGINLRAGRGTKFAVIRVVQEGERFLVQTDPRTGWWHITTGTGEDGYMHSSKIKREREARESDLGRFPAFQRAAPAEESGEPEPVEPDEPQVETPPVPQPQPRPVAPEPVSPQRTSGERVLPDPSTARLTQRELGRLLQAELTRLADPSLPRDERRALETSLGGYFRDADVLVTRVLSSGRTSGRPIGVRTYLMRLRMTGNYQIIIKDLSLENGKVSALTVHEAPR